MSDSGLLESRNLLFGDEYDPSSDTPLAHEVECSTEGVNLLRLQEAASTRNFSTISGRRVEDFLRSEKQRSLHAHVIRWPGRRKGEKGDKMPYSPAWAFILSADQTKIVKNDLVATYHRFRHSRAKAATSPQLLIYIATDLKQANYQGDRVHHIHPNSVDFIMERFQHTMEHLPIPISDLSRASTQRLFILSQLSTAETTGFQIEESVTLGLYSKSPSIKGSYDYIDPSAWTSDVFRWTLPIHNMDRNVEIPDPHPAFRQFHTAEGQKRLTGKWEGVSIQMRQYAVKLGFYLQSRLSGFIGDKAQMALQHKAVLDQFGIAHAVRDIKVCDLAYCDKQTGKVRPTSNARIVIPWLFDIETSKYAKAQREAICAVIQKIWLERQDVAMAWEAGCWAADMIAKYGSEAFREDEYPSEEEAAVTMQQCANSDCNRFAAHRHLYWVRTTAVNGKVCKPCKNALTSQHTHGLEQDPAALSTVATTTRDSLANFAGKETSPRSMRHLRKNVKQSLRDEMLRIASKDKFGRRQVPRRIPETDELLDPLKASFHQNVTDDTKSFWTDSYLTSPFGGPWSNEFQIVSGDSIYPVAFDGAAGIHLPGNLALTKRYANELKGTWPPIVLQLFSLLDKATDPQIIKELVLRLDNLVLVRRQVPWSVRERNQMSGDGVQELIAGFQEQCQSGIPSLEACKRRGLDDVWKINVYYDNGLQSATPKLDAVKKFIKDFEDSDPSCDRLPRLGDDVPYPFKGGPVPKVWTWPIVYAYFASKLKILKYNCNRGFITTITVPQLIVVTFYLLWVPKDHPSVRCRLFNLPCSFYTQTPTRMSIGKALHGRQMRSGLPVDGPLLFSALDLSDINILPEPWLANSAKHDWDSSVDAVRQDFRSNLRQDNPPFWSERLAPMNDAINKIYIIDAPAKLVVSEGDEDAEEDNLEGTVTRSRSSSASSSVSRTSDDQAKLPPSSLTVRGRNLTNIGQTCYMSTVLQALLKQPVIQSFLSNKKNFVYKKATGNSDVLMVPPGVTLTADQHEKHVTSTLKKYKHLIDGLSALFENLGNPGRALDASATKSILERMHKIDQKWENKSNESAQLYESLLNIMVRASDTSEPTNNRGPQTMRLESERSALVIAGQRLPPLVQDAGAFRRAYEDDGHLSDIVDLTTPQIVQELLCDEQGCTAISRTFLSEPLIYLDFQSGVQASDHFTLAQLLDLWKLDEVSTRCRKNKGHFGASEVHKRFSKLSRLICFAFRRSIGPDMPKLLNHVELPDVLDLQTYASAAGLPSNLLYGEELEIDATKYRLRFVSHYRHIGQHYIGYSDQSQTEDLQWIRFDDTEPLPRRMNPIEGNVLGEVVHFAIYERTETPARQPPLTGKVATFRPEYIRRRCCRRWCYRQRFYCARRLSHGHGPWRRWRRRYRSAWEEHPLSA